MVPGAFRLSGSTISRRYFSMLDQEPSIFRCINHLQVKEEKDEKRDDTA